MANNRELSQFANVVGYSGGNIGIGTDNPSANIDVQRSGTGTIARFGIGDGTTSLDIKYSSNTTTFDQQNSKSIAFETGNAERVRIDSSGNLNIVSSTSSLTDLNFTASDLSVYARVEGGKSGSGVGDLRFHTYSGGLSEAARITSAGRVGINSIDPATALDIQSTSSKI